MAKPMSADTLVEFQAIVDDLEYWGNPDDWKLMSRIFSQKLGWKVSMKAYDIGNKVGCLVAIFTENVNHVLHANSRTSITFVPDVKIQEEIVDGIVVSRKLVKATP